MGYNGIEKHCDHAASTDNTITYTDWMQSTFVQLRFKYSLQFFIRHISSYHILCLPKTNIDKLPYISQMPDVYATMCMCYWNTCYIHYIW